MSQKIYIGSISKGLERFYLPFNIDNDSFPTLFNFYTWRGRIKRKRGTIPLDRMQRQVSLSAAPASWQYSLSLSAGSANLLTAVSAGNGSSIVSGSISLTVSGNTYTEPATPDGTLTGSPSGTGTINYTTGVITITGGGSSTVTGSYSYYPSIPAMGLRDLSLTNITYPVLLAFDTKYAYQINTATAKFYNISYYKYSKNPVLWSGTDSQLFWSANYQGSTTSGQAGFWATNNKPGFHFLALTPSGGVTVSELTATTVTINLNSNGLGLGDLIFINEVTGTIATGSGATANQNINNQVGRVTTTGANSFTATFDGTAGSTLANFQGGATGANGIAQYLTKSVVGVGDGIRWYDGDPTAGTGINPDGTVGWVNFSPPLSASPIGIEDVPAASTPYYLVGALIILSFKDRLVFFSPWIQSSANGSSPILLKDTALWSWNGTPYYANFPSGQTADPTAYYVNQTGKGGYLSAGLSQQIYTVNYNEDVLLVGFLNRQTRFVYTGNDLFPFLFYNINVEFGSAATFSSITLDRGAITMGVNGFTLTSQTGAQRIDLSIPDQIFQLKGDATTPNFPRVSAARDYYHEWAYFTFVPDNSQWNYPTQTFQYNYRENSWAIHYENFTTHGQYRQQIGYTWATIPFPTWESWNETWDSASSTALFPSVAAGTPQGFVVIKGQGTGEAPTGAISTIAQNGTLTQITSYNHCVAVGDYILFQSAIGSTFLNSQIGQVETIIDANNFVIDIDWPVTPGSYKGLGTFTRLIQPLLQTKQFPVFWQEGYKVRIGAQKYLLDTTDAGQATVNIYLSQDPDNAWNGGSLVPSDETDNSSLIYSQTIYTCPEASNIGLTEFTESINNPSPIANTQRQIWHRINTSLIGDTFQVGITLNDSQMRDLGQATSEITLHAMQFDVGRGPLLT